MPRSIKDIERVKRMNKLLKEVEEAVKNSPWMLPSEKEYIMDGDPLKKGRGGMSWVKHYLKSGRNIPSMEMIEKHMFEGRGVDGMDIRDMIREMGRTQPTHNFYQRELYKHVSDLIGARWANWMPPMSPRPINYTIQPSCHYCKTDEYGYRFFIPQDRDGIPIPDFDKKDLSQSPSAIVERSKHGMMGVRRTEDGYTLPYYELPVISDVNRAIVEGDRDKALKRLEEQQGKEQDSPFITEAKLRGWAESVVIPEELEEYKAQLKTEYKQLKALEKQGQVTKADVKRFDIDVRLKIRKAELEKRYLDPDYTDNLFALQKRYDEYLQGGKKK